MAVVVCSAVQAERTMARMQVVASLGWEDWMQPLGALPMMVTGWRPCCGNNEPCAAGTVAAMLGICWRRSEQQVLELVSVLLVAQDRLE